MEKKGFVHTLPFKLICALAVGIVLGLALHVTDTSPLSGVVLNVIVCVKYVVAQFINFCVPLIIIGFIAPSITRLGGNASKMLLLAICLAYVSCRISPSAPT